MPTIALRNALYTCQINSPTSIHLMSSGDILLRGQLGINITPRKTLSLLSTPIILRFAKEPAQERMNSQCYHLPVIATVSPAFCRLTNSVVPSGEKHDPASSVSR